MVFKPHSRFLEQMLAMLRYPMRSSRKRSVEPSRNTCLGVPGRPGTVSTRAWQLRRNRAPNLGQVHPAKRACTHACSSRKRRGWEPRRTHPPQTPFKTQKKLGCGMVFKPHSCFLEQMLAMLRYPMRSSRKRSVEPSRTSPAQAKPAPPPRRAPSPRCKMWFQKKNCPKVSVKTFRTKLSPKTLLAPKPLTISINP